MRPWARVVLGLVALPLWSARLEKLELTVLPRSGGRVLVDVRGEVEEGATSPSLTVLGLEGLHEPVVKFHAPEGWRWEQKADAVSLRISVPPGLHEFSLQVEGLPSRTLRVISDLPAQRVRIFLPTQWNFPGRAVDRVALGRHRLTVYEVPGTFPLLIPLGKGKPVLLFLIAGGGVLLALGVGALLLFRRSHPAPVPKKPEKEPEMEAPVEVEPEEEEEEERTGGLSEVIEPVQRGPSSEPSVMTDAFALLGVISSDVEREEEETEESIPDVLPGETTAPPDLEELENVEEKMRKLAQEVGIPQEEPLPEFPLSEGSPESPSWMEEEEGPISIEMELLAEKGEARSIEAELLTDKNTVSLPPQEQEEEGAGDISSPLEVFPAAEEKSTLLAGVKVEASFTDMLEMGDFPQEFQETPELVEPSPKEDEEDLRVEVDEAFLAGAEEFRARAKPETSPEPSFSRQELVQDAPAGPVPRESQPEKASTQPLPEPEVESGPFPSSPEAKSVPSPSSGSSKPERPSPPQKPAGTSPSDREALIREWLLKRKKKQS